MATNIMQTLHNVTLYARCISCSLVHFNGSDHIELIVCVINEC